MYTYLHQEKVSALKRADPGQWTLTTTTSSRRGVVGASLGVPGAVLVGSALAKVQLALLFPYNIRFKINKSVFV